MTDDNSGEDLGAKQMRLAMCRHRGSDPTDEQVALALEYPEVANAVLDHRIYPLPSGYMIVDPNLPADVRKAVFCNQRAFRLVWALHERAPFQDPLDLVDLEPMDDESAHALIAASVHLLDALRYVHEASEVSGAREAPCIPRALGRMLEPVLLAWAQQEGQARGASIWMLRLEEMMRHVGTMKFISTGASPDPDLDRFETAEQCEEYTRFLLNYLKRTSPDLDVRLANPTEPQIKKAALVLLRVEIKIHGAAGGGRVLPWKAGHRFAECFRLGTKDKSPMPERRSDVERDRRSSETAPGAAKKPRK